MVSYQEFDTLFLDIFGKQTPETELQNTKGATASEIAAPKPELDATTIIIRLCSTFYKDF